MLNLGGKRRDCTRGIDGVDAMALDTTMAFLTALDRACHPIVMEHIGLAGKTDVRSGILTFRHLTIPPGCTIAFSASGSRRESIQHC
jgi:hypothetical protein